MLQPKKILHKSVQKGRNRGVATRCNDICFGKYGFKALENGLVTAKQIETIRVLISKILGKRGKMWIRIFPFKPITRKPLGVRMGSGKGAFEFWAAVIKAGCILFEIDGVDEKEIFEVANVANDKLSIKLKCVKKENVLYI